MEIQAFFWGGEKSGSLKEGGKNFSTNLCLKEWKVMTWGYTARNWSWLLQTKQRKAGEVVLVVTTQWRDLKWVARCFPRNRPPVRSFSPEGTLEWCFHHLLKPAPPNFLALGRTWQKDHCIIEYWGSEILIIQPQNLLPPPKFPEH